MAEVTYGRLDEVLRSLGFSARTNEASDPMARVYEHEGTGATIVLPVAPSADPVLPRHLLAVRSLLDAYGVTDPLDFEAVLRKVG